MSVPAAPAVRVEQGQKRLRVYLAGDLVADTLAPLLVWENPNYPAYYIPAADVLAALVPAGERDRHEHLGEAEILHVTTSRATAERAARRYTGTAAAALRDAIRLDWAAMSEWLEEDEPVYVHPRDPHKRVDILASSRRVRVELDGVTVAESCQPRILFETGLPPRYYLPVTDLRMDLLRESDRTTRCPYKGTASYWSVDTSAEAGPGRPEDGAAGPGRLHQDVVWIYRAPVAESQKIAGLACFYNERADIYLDGVLQPKPKSPFS